MTMRIEKSGFHAYNTYLEDPPRPGGNQTALHRHVIIIGGDKYAFFAHDSGKFAHKGERISFDWAWDRTGEFRNIDKRSFQAFTKDGAVHIRGNRNDPPRPRPAGRPSRQA
ncbi:hypothetical protein [Brevundimonas sp.]|jgi:hypothetical protein|uniref:hypothetical protein n=1 Tax=Brevundimonas sp. TaxID=1871086 RepID=UPI002E14F07E